MEHLKCPYCDFEVDIHIQDDASAEELKKLKECPCGKTMETEQDIEARMKRRGIKGKVFYALMRHNGKTIALKRNGIVFEKCGMTLYAYASDRDYNVCYVIIPETGLSLQTIYHPLDTIYRHISPKKIAEFKQVAESRFPDYYAKKKKEFQEAERVDMLEEP